jgi:hypothetical protein
VHLRDATRPVEPPSPLAEPDPAEHDHESDDDGELDRQREPGGMVGD